MSYGTGNPVRWTNNIQGFASNGTTPVTLTAASSYCQGLTGSSQVVNLPNTTTLSLGTRYQPTRPNSNGATIQTAGAITITDQNVKDMVFTCIDNTTDAAASWLYYIKPNMFGAGSYTSTGIINYGSSNSFTTDSVSIGASADGSSTNGTAFGSFATGFGSDCSVFGYNISSSANSTVLLGQTGLSHSFVRVDSTGGVSMLSTSVTDGVCIGDTGSISGSPNASVSIGGLINSAPSGATDTLAIGSRVIFQSTTANSVGIGSFFTLFSGAGTSATGCIVIGRGSSGTSVTLTTTNNNLILIGIDRLAIDACDNSVAIGSANGLGATINVANAICLGDHGTTGTVASGSSGFSIGIPSACVIAGAPGAATDALVIMINGSRYKIALTAFA